MVALFTPSAYAANVDSLSTQVIDAAKARGKTAQLFRDMAAPSYGDLALQGQVAELLTAVRTAITVKREAYCKWLSGHGRAVEVDSFKKSVIDQVTYAGKVAGETAGCKFAWNKKKNAYLVEEAKAANEPEQATATGKDANSAEQSSAMVAAAEHAPIMTKAQRMAQLDGALQALIKDGYTLEELTSAVHGLAMVEAAKLAETAAQEKAGEPKAPGILAEKQAAATGTMASAMEKAEKKAATKKRAA